VNERIGISARILGLLGRAVKVLDEGVEKGVTFDGTITVAALDGDDVDFTVTFDDDVHYVELTP
jgi:hypothetical protein